MTTFADIFSGFGGAAIGARAAGCELAFGIEIDPKIAEVARANGHPVTVADVLECSPSDFERVDILHASPPCTRASVANHSAELDERGLREAALDRALATKTAEFVTVLRPKVFILENVWGYRRFTSWRIIDEALYQAGYWLTVSHLDAADMAVPQNRKRMIVRAILGGYLPPLPPKEKWVGWYAAIEDLIPTLPESRFADWQLARLSLDVTTLVDSAGYVDADGRLPVQRQASQPANTIVSNHSIRPMRAFILGGQYGQPQNVPDRTAQRRDEGEPIFTVTAVNKGDWRAWLSAGRVVAMTSRALARFQSFPDSYQLPDHNGLAVRGIGNAIPPLMYQKIIKPFMEMTI
jgi:DNA (cytosine-5)-methyltransferase 1